MKNLLLLLCLLFCSLMLQAQAYNGFVLVPGPSKTLLPNQSMNLYLQHYLLYGNLESSDSLSDHVVNWTVNGKDAAAISPADGTVRFGTTAEDAKIHITYTAPSVAPAKNPVAIAVIVKTKGKGELMLVCNVTIVKTQYKLTMDAEETGPKGIHYKLEGECFTNLKPLADGTFMLEPVDKSRSMYITVQDATAVNADGGSAKLVAPKQYTVPFLFSIDKMGKSQTQPAKEVCYLNTLSPQKDR